MWTVNEIFELLLSQDIRALAFFGACEESWASYALRFFERGILKIVRSAFLYQNKHKARAICAYSGDEGDRLGVTILRSAHSTRWPLYSGLFRCESTSQASFARSHTSSLKQQNHDIPAILNHVLQPQYELHRPFYRVLE